MSGFYPLIPFGLKDGQFMTVEEVGRGLQSDCVCPRCKKPLVANKGRHKRPYFSHPGNSCYLDETDEKRRPKKGKHSKESDIHRYVKNIVYDLKCITLPALTYSIWDIVGSITKPIKEPQTINLDEVVLEKSIEDIRVDIFCMVGKHPLIIEVVYSHWIRDKKLDKLRKLRIPSIEINLSHITPDTSYSELAEIITASPDYKSWIFSNKILAYEQKMRSESNIHQITPDSAGNIMFSKVHTCPAPRKAFKNKSFAWLHECQKCQYWNGFTDAKSMGHILCGWKKEEKEEKPLTAVYPLDIFSISKGYKDQR